MNIRNENVVLFPKWKTSLENKSKEALKEKRYQDALGYLESLTDYDINTHEVLTGKLICLMELGRQEEAEDLCQLLINNKDEYYYDYIHIYTTLLFQSSRYQELIDLLNDELETNEIPEPLKTQLLQVYEISERLNWDKKQELGTRYFRELESAVDSQNEKLQWRIINKFREVNINPYISYMENLLLDEEIHPLVKTSIVDCLSEQEVNQQVNITKFNDTVTINPSRLKGITDHPVTVYILKLLGEVEQRNPSLFELMEKLLYRYMYVRYPVMPSEDALVNIANALVWMGNQYLQLDTRNNSMAEDGDVHHYIEEITQCEQIYFSIMEE